MSTTIFEKPLSHLGLVDWIRNIQELKRYSFERVQFAFDIRYDVRKTREIYRTNAKWTTYRNTKLLRDKVEDVTFWREEFANKVTLFAPVIKKLRHEKAEVDNEINKMEELYRVASECNSLRDRRMLAELVNDRVRDELRLEIVLADENKKLLQKLSHCAWEKLNYLDNLQFRLNQELEQKIETVAIDTEQANLTIEDTDKISYKVDALKIAKHSETLDVWAKRQQAILNEAETQLAASIEARETLFLLRGKARDMMDAQIMATENVLRRRIYETDNAVKELEWHKKRIEDAMSRFSDEMNKLELQIQECVKKIKLAETRLINKTYRAIGEKGLDTANEAIRLEARVLNDMIKDLRNKSGSTKMAYNSLERQYRAVTDDLLYKTQALEFDRKVFDIKDALKISSKMTQYERTIMLLNYKERPLDDEHGEDHKENHETEHKEKPETEHKDHGDHKGNNECVQYCVNKENACSKGCL